MFTGLVEEIGTIRRMERGAHSVVLSIRCERILSDLEIGDSVAVNGVCLTATRKDAQGWEADVMHETLNRSSLGNLQPGSAVNLERALPVNGRLGGHIVSGHIDGTGIITDIRKDDTALWFTVRAEAPLLRYVVEKGSIAIDGISLTVAKVDRVSFSVSLIPHTAEGTILAKKRVGDVVNLETDLIGKYVEKLLASRSRAHESGLTKAFLEANGF